MTPNPTPARPTPTPPRPGAPAASGGGAFSIDPVKLLLKYKWLLAGAAGLGLILGTISHFVLLKVYPVFTSEVIFECLPPDLSPGQITPPTIDREEIQLFMGSQVDRMKSDFVLASVVRDPRLPAEAPKWTRPYQKSGGFDLVNAQEDLAKVVKSSMVPNTYFIRLAASTNYRNDTAGIVRLVKENYMDDLRKRSTSDVNKRKDVTRAAIRASERQLEDLNARRQRLVRDQRLDTLDGQKSQVAESLRITNYELLKVEQALESAQVGLARDEAQLQRGTGIQYDNQLRLEVEASQQMLQLQSQLNLLESRLSSLRADGVMPQHREFRTTQSEIDGTRQQIELTRERLLREAFESRVDSYRLYIQQLQAQQSDLLRQIEELGTEMVQLTSIVGEVTDIDRSIQTTIEMIANQQMALADLDAAASLDTATRVRVVQSETVPDVPTFPKIYIMIPLGVILLTGLVTGVILVVEILDQRVKGPSDLAALGRMNVLGIVPDAAEDPSDPQHPESVFRDVPGSVMAEHYRQIRTRVSKAMIRQGHKTLVVVGATPGSGATSVVSNLGSALVAAGHKVLVVDANYRRPRLHLAFDAPEGPGLADVLTGNATLDSAIVRTRGEGTGPDLLPVGSPKHRMIEQLGTQGIEKVLADAAERYEFVLLDVAPALVAGDAQTLANRCDASMLVARAMHEKRGMVARLRNELSESRAEFLGAMVNAVRSSAGGYMRKNIRTQANYASDPTGQAA